MRDGIIARILSALLIFGFFGAVSVSIDVDSIWKILEIQAPIDFTDTIGRNFHTALLFIMYACSVSIIATALASGSNKFRRCLGLSMAGDCRGISTPVWEPISGNYSDDTDREWSSYKKVGER